MISAFIDWFWEFTRVAHSHERWVQLFCDANTYLQITKGFTYIHLGMNDTSGKAFWTLISLQANKIQNSDNKGDHLQDHLSNYNSKGTGNYNRVNKPAFLAQTISTHTCGTNFLFHWSKMCIHWHTMLLSDHTEHKHLKQHMGQLVAFCLGIFQ
jgi:hypothetical protein